MARPINHSRISLIRRIELILIALCISSSVFSQSYKDLPFLQDYAEKYDAGIQNSKVQLLRVRCDRNHNIKVLSTQGILQPWKGKLVKDQLYRPVSDLKIISISTYQDQIIYLTDNAIFSNAWAGKFYVRHTIENCSHFAIGDDFSILLAAAGNVAFYMKSEIIWKKKLEDFEPIELMYDGAKERFIILSKNALFTFEVADNQFNKRYSGKNLTSICFTSDMDQIVVGTEDGIFTLDPESFKETSPLNKKLPDTHITCIREINGKRWFGSSKGAFTLRDDGKFDYYASKRWLVDDRVIDISPGPENSVLILTEGGLSKINFDEMTLADKADYFQKVQRLRHIRYGFSSETNLQVPGDLSTAVLRDTDNDGLWTSMYLAGELFRYAATKSDDALQNAYEAFEAMERLTEISGIMGFPARTYEVDGYQSSDTDPEMPEDQKIWRLAEDGRWRWKSTTSSDESCGHFFVYALFAEIVPDEKWRNRAIHQIKIEIDHIIENDWYLVTWNGEITQWGRWNPDYVNSFPIQVGDRRLNSTLIIAFLQTAYHFTGDEIYKQKAYELMDQYGYLENILRPASVIGFVEGQILSDSWNHSDDEMYFLTVPALIKYAFNEELREKYFQTVKSHWEIERSERNPLWNFIYALVGAKDFDLNESIWWLKEFPLDLIAWDVYNSHRKDIEFVEPNFRKQKLTEVLPRDERPMHLHNNAYIIDGRGGGSREYPPYIYLLPYWLGRYIGAISPAN